MGHKCKELFSEFTDPHKHNCNWTVTVRPLYFYFLYHSLKLSYVLFRICLNDQLQSSAAKSPRNWNENYLKKKKTPFINISVQQQ